MSQTDVNTNTVASPPSASVIVPPAPPTVSSGSPSDGRSDRRGAPRRAVSVRSVLLGLAGVLFICGLTPYNDFVVNNTFLVGNFMPVGLLLFFLTFVAVVNAPLWRWWPRMAFGAGELGVALGMTLVSCTLPGSGLMRYLPAHLANIHHHANENVDYGRVLGELDLPDWAFPTFAGTTVRERAGSDVVKYYRTRIPPDEPGRWGPVLGAWVRPAFAWGLLLACAYGAVLCASVIVRTQWVDNERLAFPLANVYASLIEAPPPGRSFNALFAARSFWITASGVFAIHLINGLHQYDPSHWPEVSISFNLSDVLANPPWSFTEYGFKVQTLYFCIVGFAFFMQSSVSFSIWFCYAVLLQLAYVNFAVVGAEFDSPGRQADLWFGTLIPFAGTVLWVGRKHWSHVLGRMSGRRRRDGAVERYLPLSLAGWGLVACGAGMFAWLVVAGATVAGAGVLMAMLALIYLVVARIVAETGLIFVQVSVPVNRPWVYLLQSLPASLAVRPPPAAIFWSGMVGGPLAHDVRESLPPYATHALRVNELTTVGDRDDRAGGRRGAGGSGGVGVIVCLVVALAVGFVVAGASTLFVEYTYGATLDRRPQSPINQYGVNSTPVNQVLSPTNDFRAPRDGPNETHNHPLHVGIGMVLSGACSLLRLRFAGWPLHPIGLLTCFSYPLERIWFSVFIGWLVKAVVVRFGGSNMIRSAGPAFTGLIIGEVTAAAFWLVVSLSLNAMGFEYTAINLLPG